MSVSEFDSHALEQCRITVGSQTGKFGGLGDGFANRGGNASIFGKLPSSGRLSSAVDGVNRTMASELHAAESVLGKVERALDAVQRSVEDTERANARSLTQTV